MSQQQLAAAAGISLRAVRYIEQDKVSRPRPESVRRLASAVGLDLPANQFAGALRIDVLGPLVVHRGHGRVDPGPLKQRALLGVLAMQPNRVVDNDEIASVLWGFDPPLSHTSLIHTYVARLRKSLVSGGSSESGIATVQGGYRLDLASDQLDLMRFDELTRRANGADRDGGKAMDLLAEALGCWRGRLLEDGPAQLREHPSALDVARRRIDATLKYADFGLFLGRYDEVIAQLRALATFEPLNEALHARLMKAMNGSGNQVGALEVYCRLRQRLDEELGIEPGREARDAYVSVLRGDTEAPAERSNSSNDGVANRRNLLPRSIDDFTGRAEEIDQLQALVAPVADTSTIISIDGMPGVGKTTLAVQVAWRLREHFPDGQLFVDLRGHTSGCEPLEPVTAMRRLLQAFGVDHGRLPVEVDECAMLWRGALANRKVLIVLDNAACAEQVRPLLPSSAGCLVLVTSRHRLTGLESGHNLSIDVLPEREAVALFLRIVGDERTAGAEGDARETVRMCGGLPLAIRIAAARLRHRPAWNVAHLNVLLSREQRRLTELSAGDLSVMAAFTVSFQHLNGPIHELFLMLGLHPGGDFDRHAAAALGGLDPDAAEVILEALVDVHLLRQVTPDRYQFHDLLRTYAYSKATAEVCESRRRQALRRLVDHYLHIADLAADQLDPSRARIPVEVLEPPAYPIEPESQQQAIEWFDVESYNLVATTSLAAAQGWRGPAWQLPRSLWRFFLIRGHYQDWIDTHHIALESLAQQHDSRGHIETLTNLAFAHWRGGRFDDALACNGLALDIAARSGDPEAEAKVLNSLAFVYDWIGRCGLAIENHAHAIKLYRELGDPWGVNRVLTGLGNAHRQLGGTDEAGNYFSEALALARSSGDTWGECLAHAGMSLCTDWLGKSKASEHGRHAVVLAGKIGDRWIGGMAYAALARCYVQLGSYADARTHADEALQRARELADRWMEGQAHLSLGNAYRLVRSYELALEHSYEALRVAESIGSLGISAAAHNDLGDLHGLTGNVARSIEHYRNALALAEDIGNPLEQRRARGCLAHAAAAASG